MPMNVNVILQGITQNNLKDIDIELPLGKAIVVTGPSGSGKSSLAFETVYAEGQRRYMQSLSTYARQFMEKFRAPRAKAILNIPPTIALEQNNPVRNSRATVGTTTELYDYLRLLFEKIGTEYCDRCHVEMQRLRVEDICEMIIERYSSQTIVIAFRRELPESKTTTKELLEEQLRNGFSRLLWKDTLLPVDDERIVVECRKKSVAFPTDRIRMPPEPGDREHTRLMEALHMALELGGNTAELWTANANQYELAETFTTLNRCPQCNGNAAPKSATSFSFNSPLGACETCKGFGNTLEIDPDLVVPNPQLTLAQGAIDPFTKPSLNYWQKKLHSFCAAEKIDTHVPFRELPEEHRRAVFEGGKRFRGVRGVFRMLEKEKYKMRIRVFISRYTSPFTCPDCGGKRLNKPGLSIRIGGKDIAEIADLSIEQCLTFFTELSLSDLHKKIAADILSQIHRRLKYLDHVGLGYLTLSRLTRTLSGGEYQRILLATQLSQGLTDTLYVLDEPSIGLHPKDTHRLLEVLTDIRKRGNTLLIVEHDPEIISWGEHIVDLGPGSGRLGGTVVFSGSRDQFLLSSCLTSESMRLWKRQCARLLERSLLGNHEDWIEIHGACANNLKHVTVRVPLECLVAVTGVSGSGKSTLIVDTLYQALAKIFHGRSEKIGRFDSISGFEKLSNVELIDQSPIGKSSRSNPITFMKAYDEIRSLYAQTREALSQRLTPGHFSFNVSGGRCDVCEGEGRIRVDMVFMEDIFVPCQACDEKRFKPHILAIRYRGKNIDDCLKMTVEEAFGFFEGISPLRSKLALLQEVGLGYLQIGQPSYTLSGGEAQRLKIARELVKGTERRERTLFILDEPTTGLHFNEIEKLIHVLKRLVSSGQSVIVIEHNLQMVCAAQYVIDLGPDGGDHGGRVVAIGTPSELAQKKLPHTGLHLSEILQ